MDLVGGSFDLCQSSLLCDNDKGVRTLLLTLVGLHVRIRNCLVIKWYLHKAVCMLCETVDIKFCCCRQHLLTLCLLDVCSHQTVQWSVCSENLFIQCSGALDIWISIQYCSGQSVAPTRILVSSWRNWKLLYFANCFDLMPVDWSHWRDESIWWTLQKKAGQVFSGCSTRPLWLWISVMIGRLALYGWLLHLVQQRVTLVGGPSGQSSSLCTKYSSWLIKSKVIRTFV